MLSEYSHGGAVAGIKVILGKYERGIKNEITHRMLGESCCHNFQFHLKKTLTNPIVL